MYCLYFKCVQFILEETNNSKVSPWLHLFVWLFIAVCFFHTFFPPFDIVVSSSGRLGKVNVVCTGVLYCMIPVVFHCYVT